MSKFEPVGYISIVAMSQSDAQRFAREAMGIPEERIARVYDAGPATGERYKENAREYRVTLTTETHG
jgi:hypothetical protein